MLRLLSPCPPAVPAVALCLEKNFFPHFGNHRNRRNQATMTDLLQPENLLPLLIHHLHAGVVIHAADTRILFANEQAAQLLGLTLDQMTGKMAIDPAWAFLHEDETPLTPAEYPVNRVLATGQPIQDLIVGVDRPDTRDRVWTLVNAFPEFPSPEDPGRIVVTFIDITERKRAEDHLRSISRMQSIILDNSTVGITFVRNRIQEWANPRMAELFGIPLERLQNISTRILYPDDASFDMVATQAYPLLARGQKAALEAEMRKGDGSTFWCRLEGQALDASDPNGSSIWIWEDITERKRAKEQLQQLTRMQSVILDNSTVGIALVRNRVLEWVNLRMSTLFGQSPERLQGASTRILYPDDASFDMVNSQAYPLLARGQKAAFEIQMQKGDGARFWCRFEGNSLNPAQPQNGSIWICEDITERKRAEEALRESEERFRTLVDSAPEGIFVQSAGHFLYLNPAMVKLFGAAGPEDLIDTDFMVRIAPEYHEAIRERIRLQRETGAPAPPMFQEYLQCDGTRIPVETEAVPFRFQGRDAHLVFVRDITARRKAEAQRENLQTQLQQAQKMDSVGRLAGGVAHDFNNMLGVILGHADLILAQIDPAHEFFADLLEIQKAAARSADLTRQLLAFARKQTVAPKVLDLNETVEGMLKMLRRLIGENIDLAWHPTQKPATLKMDPSQIDQILANLCVNARDAIGATGQVTIETDLVDFDEPYCTAHPGYLPGKYVLLGISDDGCGMDSETLLHLFEPFFTTKKVGEGTGLGLATVYGIIKQNKGFINVYSEKGHGTTFKIYLPRHAPASDHAPKTQAPQPLARGTETILLVEDEPMLLDMTRTMLEHAGYQVFAAASPAEAIRLGAHYAGHIHLLITDVVMPEMNGRELAQTLLIQHPHLKRLFMSGYTANVIAHHGILDPGVHFIQKPFSTTDLATKVREVIKAETPNPP